MPIQTNHKSNHVSGTKQGADKWCIMTSDVK
jgi:hypothetical protein